MDVILKVTVLFTLVLALSFLIERLLEILKSIYDLVDSRLDWYRFWTKLAISLRNRLERQLRIFEYVNPKEAASVLNRFEEMLLNNKEGYEGTIPTLSGDLVRTLVVKASSKLLGIGLGIGLAFWMNIDLLGIWQEAAGNAFKWVSDITTQGINIVLSGVVMGLGSGPVHKIITAMDKKREQKQKGAQP